MPIDDPPDTVGADTRTALVELTHRHAAGIDHRDWALLRSVFGDRCEIDFSSWSGAPPADLAADVWVDAVRSVTGRFDATQHLIANHRFRHVAGGVEGGTTVDGTHEVQIQHWFSAASMAAFGRAEEPGWCLVGGHHENRYVLVDGRWRITRCRFVVRWRTGDETVFALARRR